MQNTGNSCWAIALLLFGACASSETITPERAPITALGDIRIAHEVPIVPAVETTALARCLLEGGALEVVDSVDNDDVAEHGQVLTFDVSGERRIAVAAEDGTIKLWTLEGFVGSVEPARLTYGPEVPLAPAPDVAFWNGALLSGDVRGMVGIFDMESLGLRPIGGAEPGVAIRAVAARGDRFAHAEDTRGGNVIVRGLTSGELHGPLATGAVDVRDLAFTDEDALVLGGGDDGEGVLERWEDEVRTAAQRLDSEVVEVATAGPRVAAVGEGYLALLDADLDLERTVAFELAPRSVDLTPQGDVALMATEAVLAAWDAGAGEPLAVLPLEDLVRVRVESAGELAFTASADGTIRALGCR